MSERKEDGGPAFPTVPNTKTHHHGMTLRDWFAGQALGGLLATEPDDIAYGPSELAERSYRFADAMLAERSK